jgi:hypothetical protein
MLTSTTFELPGVGVRYDTGPMVGAAEVLCYGTAVVTEARPEGRA